VFLCTLLKHKAITNCEVGCPSRVGWPNVRAYLKGIKALDLVNPVLRGVLVVADSDDKPDAQFLSMSAALDDAEFPAPSKTFSIEGDPLRTAIFIMPREGQDGTLEHILLEAVLAEKPQLQECLDDFLGCTGTAAHGSENQKAKMRMSSLVSALCIDNPWASAAMMWNSKGNPVPIESRCFKHISDFLAEFCR